jgi:hypothetical protein
MTIKQRASTAAAPPAADFIESLYAAARQPARAGGTVPPPHKPHRGCPQPPK